jgi:hypothetical protein
LTNYNFWRTFFVVVAFGAAFAVFLGAVFEVAFPVVALLVVVRFVEVFALAAVLPVTA